MNNHTTSKNGLPWIEKYRPIKFDMVISHQHIVDILKKYVKHKTLPNMILFGPPGTGKTSLIKSCANELYGNNMNVMTLEINASEERGIDIVRDRITTFANNQPTFAWNRDEKLLKLIILDEADSMTFDAQIALKNIFDTFAQTTRICLICNCIKKIHISLVSRCVKFRLHPHPHKKILDHIKNICVNEKINISQEAIDEIITCSHGDMRKVINILQSIQTAYPKIDFVCVQKYLNEIPTDTFDIIVSSLNNNSINQSSLFIKDILYKNGFSFHELITTIGMKLSDDTIKKDNKFELISNLGKIEYQLFSNVPLNILIDELVCVWKQ